MLSERRESDEAGNGIISISVSNYIYQDIHLLNIKASFCLTLQLVLHAGVLSHC
jgi:hypothetical protein